jgi:hypothetical protein
MSFRYMQMLIPTSPEFVPTPAQVQAFLAAVVKRGVIPEPSEIVASTPSTKTRKVRNRVTGEIVELPLKDQHLLPNVDAVAAAVAEVTDYYASASGMGRPANPPMPLDVEEPYYMGVWCRVSPVLRSTSDLHDESDAPFEVPFHGTPCESVLDTGYFSNPHTLEIIKVPHAGCAKFWIEFRLGKSLFPAFTEDGVDFLDPEIVAAAKRVFGVAFVQGFQWG